MIQQAHPAQQARGRPSQTSRTTLKRIAGRHLHWTSLPVAESAFHIRSSFGDPPLIAALGRPRRDLPATRARPSANHVKQTDLDLLKPSIEAHLPTLSIKTSRITPSDRSHTSIADLGRTRRDLLFCTRKSRRKHVKSRPHVTPSEAQLRPYNNQQTSDPHISEPVCHLQTRNIIYTLRTLSVNRKITQQSALFPSTNSWQTCASLPQQLHSEADVIRDFSRPAAQTVKIRHLEPHFWPCHLIQQLSLLQVTPTAKLLTLTATWKPTET